MAMIIFETYFENIFWFMLFEKLQIYISWVEYWMHIIYNSLSTWHLCILIYKHNKFVLHTNQDYFCCFCFSFNGTSYICLNVLCFKILLSLFRSKVFVNVFRPLLDSSSNIQMSVTIHVKVWRAAQYNQKVTKVNYRSHPRWL